MQKSHLFTTLFIALSIALIAFAKPTNNTAASAAINMIAADSNIAAAPDKADLSASLYESLNLSQKGLSKEALDAAIKGYEKLKSNGAVGNSKYLTVIDFSQSSRKKRFYIIDVANKKVLLNTYVAHGKNTGVDMATRFSNIPESLQSSLGFYLTKGTYHGKHGLSLRLKGQEEGFNNNAMSRGIVVHGAAYVNAGRVNSAFMGRSQGCPALPEAEYATAINYIKDGSVMFIYHPSQQYAQQSPILNS